MKFSMYLPFVMLWSLSAPLGADEALDFEDETTRTNYSLGYQIGGDFKRQGVEMNAEAVVQGIRDAINDAEPKMPPAEIRAMLQELKRKVVAEQQRRGVERELELLAEGKKFLEENARKEGVVTTASGLQYKVIEPGTGKTPASHDLVTVHYRGTHVDGRPFDSSYKKNKPATFKVNSVIKGWSEGLQLMQEGGKFQFFIPQDLAYGGRGPLAHRTLIFDVELISVEKPQPAAAKAPEKTPAQGGDGEKAKKGE